MIDAALREWFPFIVAALLIGLAWLFQWHRRRPVKDPPEGTPYRVYTTEYDIEIRAEDITGRLDTISTHHPQYWRAEGDADWEAAIESTELKVKEITASGIMADLPDNLSDVAVTLLVDHSGSMKGNSMLAVASTAKALIEVLVERKAKVELLGFTTAGWHGGFSRRQWLAKGRPRYPGRLCALMHIIYKAADDLQLGDSALRAMLNPGGLYENIDGEAIEWAEGRLLASPERHRILLVISDGAPVDDATLIHNGPSILWHHVKQVIKRIETDNAIHLCAIGINYRVSGFYRNSVAAEDLAELPKITAEFVRTMIGRMFTP